MYALLNLENMVLSLLKSRITCGGRLSPNGQYRVLKCKRCGFEEDRDVIAVLNLLRKYQMNVGTSSVHPESPPMKRGGKAIRYERNENYKSSG